MSKYTNNPNDFTNVESLRQIRTYKRHNRGTGNVPDLKDYVDVKEYLIHNCYKCGTDTVDAPGIGHYCPNEDCDVTDGLLKYVTEGATVRLNCE